MRLPSFCSQSARTVSARAAATRSPTTRAALSSSLISVRAPARSRCSTRAFENHRATIGEGRQRPFGPGDRLGIAQPDDGFDGAARSDDRAVLEHGAINGRERVEPSRDQAAQGDGQVARIERAGAIGPDGAVGVADERGELLDEERVAAAAVPQLGYEL